MDLGIILIEITTIRGRSSIANFPTFSFTFCFCDSTFSVVLCLRRRRSSSVLFMFDGNSLKLIVERLLFCSDWWSNHASVDFFLYERFPQQRKATKENISYLFSNFIRDLLSTLVVVLSKKTEANWFVLTKKHKWENEKSVKECQHEDNSMNIGRKRIRTEEGDERRV